MLLFVLAAYQQALDCQKLAQDIRQLHAVEALSQRQSALENGMSSQGLYLYGRVGRGKTMVMDMFYDTLKTTRKSRIHFHHFMHGLHKKLNELQGTINPLALVAKELAAQVDVICFDEFFVTDIADAMLLGGVFNALHQHQIMIVATSNTPPDNLYEGGLARDRFLPSIALLKQHLDVFSLDGEIDYRTKYTEYAPVYFVNDEQRFANNLTTFNLGDSPSVINVCHRDIITKGQSEDAIWFDFMALCDGPRSQNDYIYLADHFKIIAVSNVVQMGGVISTTTATKGTEDGDTNYKLLPASPQQIGLLDDCARRFIALVDELYDRQKLLVINASCSIESLYQGGRVTTAFKRTVSRLTEMQSVDYQSKVNIAAKDNTKRLF